jgi:hypothetical protein
VTSSADKSVRCWDAEAGMQIKRLTEHTSIVNSINPMARGPQLFVSGSDDSKVKVRRQCLNGTRHQAALQPLPDEPYRPLQSDTTLDATSGLPRCGGLCKCMLWHMECVKKCRCSPMLELAIIYAH